MKKIVNSLAIIITIILFSGCSRKGDIVHEPHDFMIINGKVQKLMSVVPCNGCKHIWILYPKDSLDTTPTILNYDIKNGKTEENETIIKVH